MVKTFWLSYDFGLKGDYEGLYAWLDNLKAKECGDSLAIIHVECGSDYLKEIRNNFESSVQCSSGVRVYLIWRDEETGQIRGNFLFGKRKPAPWKGYGNIYEETGEDY